MPVCIPRMQTGMFFYVIGNFFEISYDIKNGMRTNEQGRMQQKTCGTHSAREQSVFLLQRGVCETHFVPGKY